LRHDTGILGSLDAVHALPSGDVLPERGRAKRGDVLAVRGWALGAKDRKAFARVDVHAGSLVVPAMVGLSRPDVVSAFGLPPEVRAGFLATVPTETLPFGPTIISVEAVHPDGVRERLGAKTISVASARRTVRVLPGTRSKRVVVDEPTLIDVGGIAVLDVRGWALSEAGTPGGRITVVAGDAAYPARYGYPRRDVAEAFGLGPESVACGFRARIGCDEIGDAGELRAQLENTFGRFDSVPIELPAWMRSIVVPASRVPIGSIDEVAVVRDGSAFVPQPIIASPGQRLALRGWAAAPHGRTHDMVALVDGIHRTAIVDRHARPDVPASGGAVDAGFNVVVEVPDVAPGWHSVEIFALDDDGRWATTAARLNFIVTGSS
jgi:hypothetical protein